MIKNPVLSNFQMLVSLVLAALKVHLQDKKLETALYTFLFTDKLVYTQNQD